MFSYLNMQTSECLGLQMFQISKSTYIKYWISYTIDMGPFIMKYVPQASFLEHTGPDCSTNQEMLNLHYGPRIRFCPLAPQQHLDRNLFQQNQKFPSSLPSKHCPDPMLLGFQTNSKIIPVSRGSGRVHTTQPRGSNSAGYCFFLGCNLLYGVPLIRSLAEQKRIWFLFKKNCIQSCAAVK